MPSDSASAKPWIAATIVCDDEQLMAGYANLPAHELDAILKNKGLVVELTGAGNGAKVGVRDVQKDAVKNTIEHIDLVVLTAAEAAARA